MDKSLNKVELRGRVGQDAKILKTENGVMAARFTLATNEIIKGRDENLREETTWHNIVAWSDKENMPDLSKIVKGTPLHVTGRLRIIRYTSQDGVEKQFYEVLANRIRIIES